MGAKLWMIKNQKGLTYGPFDEARIIELIQIGVLGGEELVADYPSGNWIKLPQVPQFYDAVLLTLSRAVTPPDQATIKRELSRNTTWKNSEGAKNQHQSSKKQEDEDRRFEQTIRVRSNNVDPLKVWPANGEVRSGEHPPDLEIPASGPVIDMIGESEIKSLSNKKTLSLIGVLATVAVASYFLLSGVSGNKFHQDKIRLARPQPPGEKLSAETQRNKIKRALELFIQDTVADYQKAQSELVDIVSADKMDKNAIALLCLTYRELWSSCQRDETDRDTILMVSKMATNADPMGGEAGICRIVQAMTQNNFDAADSLTKTMLEEFPTKPVFYEIRASLLVDRGEIEHAIGYLERCRELWPQWIKPQMSEAMARYYGGQYSQAKSTLEKILRSKPKHPSANILLGIIEFQYLQNESGGVALVLTGLESGPVSPQLTSKALLTLALNAKRQGQRKKAIELLAQAQRADPTNLEAQDMALEMGIKGDREQDGTCQEIIELGEKYLREKNYVIAQAEFRAAFDKCIPQSPRPAIRAAEALWKLNQGKEALDWLARAIAVDSKSTEAFLLLADYSSQRFDFTTANSALRSAEKARKDLQQIYRGYALVELRRNNWVGALRFAEKALKLYDADSGAHAIAIQAALKARDVSKAYQLAARAMELDKFDPRLQGLYAEALSQFQSSRAGIDYITGLINTHPTQAIFRMTLARVLKFDEKFQEACESAKYATELEPKRKDYLIEYGEFLSLAGRSEDARKAFLMAAALDPSDPRPLYELGRLNLFSGKFQEALKYFEKAAQANSRFPGVYSLAGRAALLAGDYDLALKNANLEKKNNPNFAESYLVAGEAQMRKPQPSYSKAIAEFQNAIKLRPQGSEVYILMARAHRLSGSLDIAISMLNVALSKESGNAEIYKELGAVYEKRGQADQARQNYARYLQLSPGAEDGSLIRDRMTKLGGGGQ